MLEEHFHWALTADRWLYASIDETLASLPFEPRWKPYLTWSMAPYAIWNARASWLGSCYDKDEIVPMAK